MLNNLGIIDGNKMKFTIYKLAEIERSKWHIKWGKLTNLTDQTYTTNNTAKLPSSALEKDIGGANATGREDLKQYFNTCEKLQVYYNQKHNEIIRLHNTLKGIIKLKLDLVKLILAILKVIKVNIRRNGLEEIITTTYTPIGKPKPKPNVKVNVPKALNGIEILVNNQNILLNLAKKQLPITESPKESQAGGAKPPLQISTLTNKKKQNNKIH